MELLDLPFVDKKYLKSETENIAAKFYEFYDKVCNGIRSKGNVDDIMAEFEKLGTNFQRIKYVTTIPEVQNLFIKSTNEKDANKSQTCENDYDQIVRDETKASTATHFISKSIQTTPSECKYELARRYMKRSWASLLQERFDAALRDAERSLAYDLSSDFSWNAFEILGHCYAKQNQNRKSETHFKKAVELLRSSTCTQEMKAIATTRIASVYKMVKGRKDGKEKKGKGEVKKDLPGVSYGRHQVLESATNAVQVVETAAEGRGLFAARNIKPGDFLIVEEPFASSLNLESLDTHCINCFQRLTTPLPCSTCSLVWFCCEACEKKGSEQHAAECAILSLLYDECIGQMALIVFRILRKATWKTLVSLRDPESLESGSSDKRAKTDIGGGWTWAQKRYSPQDYRSTFHLVTNEDKRSFGDLFKRSLASIYIAECLRLTNFFEAEDTNENVLYAASLALRHLQGSSCNAYGITEYVTEEGQPGASEVREVGGAIYPTISLTNHSCDPNSLRYSIGPACVLRATKTIAKGSQVLDNYGPQFHSTSLRERRELLRSQYKFECNCDACTQDWPLYPHRAESLTFACPEANCRSDSSYLGGMKTSCALCGKSERYKSVLDEIRINLNEFERSISFLKKGQVGKALPILLSFQMFLDKTAIPPGKSLTDSQVSLKSCFLGEGNRFQATKD